jgi:hypothetical protein
MSDGASGVFLGATMREAEAVSLMLSGRGLSAALRSTAGRREASGRIFMMHAFDGEWISA